MGCFFSFWVGGLREEVGVVGGGGGGSRVIVRCRSVIRLFVKLIYIREIMLVFVVFGGKGEFCLGKFGFRSRVVERVFFLRLGL